MTGGPLPSARLVSEQMSSVAPSSEERSELTVAVMSWGQLLTHDMGHTPEQVQYSTVQYSYNYSVHNILLILSRTTYK